MADPPAPTLRRVCFSDIDGTIMFLVDSVEKVPGNERLLSPASVSGRTGIISSGTLHKVARLRAQGISFVIATGARLSTLLMRLPYLPAADAYVCENGGRIFYPGSSLPTACPLTEDAAWRTTQGEAAGSAEQALVPPEQREGALWDWLRTLRQQGWKVDATGYTTSFRVHASEGHSMEQLHRLAASAPRQLTSTFNLGAADFYPSTSGKVGAARHLLEHFGAAPENAVFLCDDDNDMPLAALVGKAFLPSVTSESVARALRERPDHFVVATQPSTCEGAEEMLIAVSKYYGLSP